jgi:hypothetical protein
MGTRNSREWTLTAAERLNLMVALGRNRGNRARKGRRKVVSAQVTSARQGESGRRE